MRSDYLFLSVIPDAFPASVASNLYQEMQEASLEFPSVYEGHTQQNVGIRISNEAVEVLDDFYESSYCPFLFRAKERFLDSLMAPIKKAIAEIAQDEDIVNHSIQFTNYPVFHRLHYSIPESKPHQDLAIYEEYWKKKNEDRPCLFTAVYYVRAPHRGGDLEFPDYDVAVPALPGTLAVFNSAEFHDISPFEGERVSFVAQFMLHEEGYLEHLI